MMTQAAYDGGGGGGVGSVEKETMNVLFSVGRTFFILLYFILTFYVKVQYTSNTVTKPVLTYCYSLRVRLLDLIPF